MTSKSRTFLSLILITLIFAPYTRADTPATQPIETKEQRDARMSWWRAARFGMFIHWGLYSVPAGTYNDKKIPGIGEWIMNTGSIPVAVYAKYAEQFNPDKFDADQWVSIAKNAGMKYIVITAKHHDGFAMFHTKVDNYNIYDAAPFKRDPLAELAQACRKQNMKLGFYYSQSQDWHHPGGAAIRRDNRKTDHWDPAQDGDYDTYLKTIAEPQVREILSNYGDVAVLWFDTPRDMTPARAQPFLDILHQFQPHIVWNNRLGGGKEFQGDTETPEQYIPPGGFPGRDWETCMTINDTWGYKSDDTNFKSPESLIRNLIDIASKGGNYLLNVGPTSQGEIPQPEIDRLQTIGNWLQTNGESIYETSATPFKRQPEFGRVTRKSNKIFLHVFNWPKDRTLWLPITNKIKRAYLLAIPGQPLETTATDGGIAIGLPTEAPDKIATVVVTELDGPPQTFVPPLRLSADGVLTLDASDAQSTNKAKPLTIRRRTQAITLKTDQDIAQWQIEIRNPITCKVELTYAADTKSAGTEVTISANDQKSTVKLDATKSADDFTTITPTSLTLNKPGQLTISIQTSQLPSGAAVNIKTIKLTLQTNEKSP